MRSTQIPLFTPQTEWVMPDELKDLRGCKQIAIDLETNDPNLKELGSGINIKGKIVDTMIAASLIDENRLSYQLNTLAKHYIGMGKDESILIAAAKEYGLDAKKDMWRLPAMFVGQYAERDAESTLKLWQRLETELYQEELWDVFNLETKLFPCLVDMRFKGVRVEWKNTRRHKSNKI